MKSETTIMLTITLALAIALVVGGLVVVPAIEQHADAKCVGFKKNGDVCKDKKPKHNT
jgi:hypothetical protein